MKDKKDHNLLDKTEASIKLYEEFSQKCPLGIVRDKSRSLIPVLRVLKGPLLGEHFLLTKSSTTIGRDSSCDICIKDAKISRKHLTITILHKSALQGEFDITAIDNQSRNGFIHNNKQVESQVALKNGDHLKIGSNTFGLYLKFKEEIDLENNLFKLATRDRTTGLLNKAFLDSNLELEFNRSLRYKRPMTFVIMDIDHFKKINDSYGHKIGDIVLKRVGEHLIKELRFEDIPIRFGGEEFAMILPETSEKDAFILIERVRKNLEKIKFKIGEQHFSITASFGIAEVKNTISTPDLLMERADKALYEAKKQGRNKSVFASKMAS